jgi:hypothetical protein
MKKKEKPLSKLMEVLTAAGATHLLGEIIAAEIIDAMEHPEATKELADFVNSPAAKHLVKARKRWKKEKPIPVKC